MPNLPQLTARTQQLQQQRQPQRFQQQQHQQMMTSLQETMTLSQSAPYASLCKLVRVEKGIRCAAATGVSASLIRVGAALSGHQPWQIAARSSGDHITKLHDAFSTKPHAASLVHPPVPSVNLPIT
jgi:hypothetical protein